MSTVPEHQRDAVLVDRRGTLWTISLNRPQARNAVDGVRVEATARCTVRHGLAGNLEEDALVAQRRTSPTRRA